MKQEIEKEIEREIEEGAKGRRYKGRREKGEKGDSEERQGGKIGRREVVKRE